MSRPFVFLDRDGTVIEDRGYAYRIEDCVLLPGAIEALAQLRDAGFGLAIVTNQSGIGRGYFGAQDLDRFHDHLLYHLHLHGIRIEAIEACPHLPDSGCECRKPAPGMVERITAALDVDRAGSFVVGDRAGDVELGLRAGCRSVLVLTGDGASARDAVGDKACVAADLRAAADHICAS